MMGKYSVGQRCFLALYVICLSLLPGGAGRASQGAPEIRTLVRAHPKLDTHLLRTAGLLPATAASRASSVLTRSAVNATGQARVVLELAAPVTPAQEAELASHGFALAAANPARLHLQGWIDPYRITELEALDFVLAIQSPPPVLVRVGRVTTEGNAILLADTLQARGITGSGVKVGVISVGDLGKATAQASGDLPAAITEISSGAASCGSNPDCGEGTAMMEIVHDLAPSASLAFCAPDSLVTMQTCVQRLVTTFHADIIVDDLGFVDEAQFEDSALAHQIGSFASAGLLYASSAGNSHGCYYEADYDAGSTVPGSPFTTIGGSYGSFHDFGLAAGGASSMDNTVVLPPFNSALGAGELTVFLQWNTPYGQPTDDYDMFLTDNNNTVLDFSVNTQSGQPGQHPFEALAYRNPSTSTSLPVHIRIARKTGTSTNNRLKLYILDNSSGCSSLGQGSATSAIQFTTPDQGDVSGHAAAQAVIAVGAIDANATDSSNYTVAEPFSSHGPVRIDFPALVMRSKPDIAAVDDVSVTGAGGFAFNGDCSTRTSCFYGTSAAAPHIAGLLALLKSGYTGDYRAALMATARVAGSSASMGAGLANGLAATTALSARTLPLPAPPPATSTAAPTASSGSIGGGGAADSVLLVLLAALSCWRRRQGRRRA
jgi:hypothetical protein